MTARELQARPSLTGAASPVAPVSPAPATFIYVQGHGDDYWRVLAPAKVLGAKVIAVPERQFKRAFTQPNSSTALKWWIELATPDGEMLTFKTMKGWRQFASERPSYLPTSVRSVFPSVEGTVVWQRPDMARASLSYAMQDQGMRTVGETDDNYFADASQNLFLRHHKFTEAERLHHARAMAIQDALVFSTAHLRDTYYSALRGRLGKWALPELHVCRNHVPLADWPERSERDGPLRVGFMGSPSHLWDVQLVYNAFRAALHYGGTTTMIGYSPGDPESTSSGWDPGDEFRSSKSIDYREKWKKVISTHIPWVAPDEYHRAALPLDIGLAPLRSDSFTLGKSDVKAVEYTISGAAVVVQNTTVYNSAGWEDEVNCLVASTDREFANATIRLIRDPKLRYELVANAQEMVMNERGDRQLREEWEAVL